VTAADSTAGEGVDR